MNSKVVGDTIKDVASSISGSTWWKRISGNGQLSEEIADTIAKSDKLGFDMDGFRGDLAQKLQTASFDQDVAEKVAKHVSPGYLDQSVNMAAKANGLDERSTEVLKKVAGKVKADTKKIDAKDMSLLRKAADYPRAYFGIEDKAVRTTRIATAAGAYAGLAVGGRLLSGGSLTHDQYGRGDIAGIPFI